MRSLLSCKKLLATAFIHTNNCIIQNIPLYTVLSGWPIARYNTKIVEATYNNIPKKVCCCLSSSKKSFFSKVKIFDIQKYKVEGSRFKVEGCKLSTLNFQL